MYTLPGPALSGWSNVDIWRNGWRMFEWWVQGLGTEETLHYERIDLHFESIRFCILRVWCIRMVSLVYDPQHSLCLILHSLRFSGGFWFISWRSFAFMRMSVYIIRVLGYHLESLMFGVFIWEFESFHLQEFTILNILLRPSTWSNTTLCPRK